MSIEGQRGPISTGVYNGFSAPVWKLRNRAQTRAGRILMGGVAAAGVLGVVFGLAARPPTPDEDGMTLDPEAVVRIEVGPGRTPVASVAASGAPLQTLPDGVQTPVVVVARAPAAPAPAARTRAIAAAASTREEQRIALTAADCSQAATPADRLACAGESHAAGDLKIEPHAARRGPPREAEVAANEAAGEPADLVIPPPAFADE